LKKGGGKSRVGSQAETKGVDQEKKNASKKPGGGDRARSQKKGVNIEGTHG